MHTHCHEGRDIVPCFSTAVHNRTTFMCQKSLAHLSNSLSTVYDDRQLSFSRELQLCIEDVTLRLTW